MGYFSSNSCQRQSPLVKCPLACITNQFRRTTNPVVPKSYQLGRVYRLELMGYVPAVPAVSQRLRNVSSCAKVSAAEAVGSTR
jgi:hypothetical protein